MKKGLTQKAFKVPFTYFCHKKIEVTILGWQNLNSSDRGFAWDIYQDEYDDRLTIESSEYFPTIDEAAQNAKDYIDQNVGTICMGERDNFVVHNLFGSKLTQL